MTWLSSEKHDSAVSSSITTVTAFLASALRDFLIRIPQPPAIPEQHARPSKNVPQYYHFDTTSHSSTFTTLTTWSELSKPSRDIRPTSVVTRSCTLRDIRSTAVTTCTTLSEPLLYGTSSRPRSQHAPHSLSLCFTEHPVDLAHNMHHTVWASASRNIQSTSVTTCTTLPEPLLHGTSSRPRSQHCDANGFGLAGYPPRLFWAYANFRSDLSPYTRTKVVSVCKKKPASVAIDKDSECYWPVSFTGRNFPLHTNLFLWPFGRRALHNHVIFLHVDRFSNKISFGGLNDRKIHSFSGTKTTPVETLGSYGHPYQVLQYTLVPFHAPLQCCSRAPDYVSVVRGSTDDFYCCFYKNVENRTHTLHFVHFVKCSSVLGGFFLACEDSGRMFDNPFTACALKTKKF